MEKKIEIIKEVVLSPNGLFIINPIMHPLNYASGPSFLKLMEDLLVVGVGYNMSKRFCD